MNLKLPHDNVDVCPSNLVSYIYTSFGVSDFIFQNLYFGDTNKIY